MRSYEVEVFIIIFYNKDTYAFSRSGETWRSALRMITMLISNQAKEVFYESKKNY